MKTLSKILAILAAIPVAFTLVQKEVLSPTQAGLLLLVIVLGLSLPSGVMGILLSIFTFLLFVTYNINSEHEIPAFLTAILPLFVALVGFYILFRGLWGRRKE